MQTVYFAPDIHVRLANELRRVFEEKAQAAKARANIAFLGFKPEDDVTKETAEAIQYSIFEEMMTEIAKGDPSAARRAFLEAAKEIGLGEDTIAAHTPDEFFSLSRKTVFAKSPLAESVATLQFMRQMKAVAWILGKQKEYLARNGSSHESVDAAFKVFSDEIQTRLTQLEQQLGSTTPALVEGEDFELIQQS